ncbi:hypothetical protein DRP53_09060 [candidate division WOR-3 bacterium]|uniref:Uncharacterized protein n=1 Tax=candidate division WOR-3 bacterium TaxID=2052148 RepID=A0A660SED4_UNCW3|nr:MAG: hypothetical protein DRP53_09060 [candidate division WOR-3 bacterium]
MFKLLITVLIMTNLLALEIDLSKADNLLLTWNCYSYAEGKEISFREIFAKAGDNIRIERWFVNPGEKPNPDARSIFIGNSKTGYIYSPCCKEKKVKTADLNPNRAVMEIAYGCPWWFTLKNSKVAHDYQRGSLVYATPYQKVYLDPGTHQPSEILYFHLRIVYDSYVSLPGLGSLPRSIKVYDGDKLVLKKSLTVSEDVSDALFHAENLPFKVGSEKIKAVDIPTKEE